MLTKRQNLLETIRGGSPECFVKQYEPFRMIVNPVFMNNALPAYGQENVRNAWGVYNSWPKGTPGAFPVHTPDKTVIKDIAHWKDYVKAPKIHFSDAKWEPFVKEAESVDRDEYFVTSIVLPGIFEQCHHLGGIENTLINFYDEPECMHWFMCLHGVSFFYLSGA